jgi:hypothetical protein
MISSHHYFLLEVSWYIATKPLASLLGENPKGLLFM